MTTGDVRQAGTSARVFIVLHGKAAATSGKIWLETGRFERGRTDIFTVDVAEQLVPLTHVDIGHDNGGAGAGWFLDKVRNDVRVNCKRPSIAASDNQSVSRLIGQTFNHSIIQSINQPINQSTKPSINQSVKINQLVGQLIKRSTNQPISQSANQFFTSDR